MFGRFWPLGVGVVSDILNERVHNGLSSGAITEGLDAFILGNANQPGANRRILPEFWQAFPCGEEHLLRNLLTLGFADPSHTVAKDAVLVVAKQRVEHLLAIRVVLQFLRVYLHAFPK
jgi:hypothetical protein